MTRCSNLYAELFALAAAVTITSHPAPTVAVTRASSVLTENLNGGALVTAMPNTSSRPT